MSSFHHDDDEEEEILQVKDYDWSDITPIKQEDGPDPVAVINYDPECKFLYFSFSIYFSPNSSFKFSINHHHP